MVISQSDFDTPDISPKFVFMLICSKHSAFCTKLDLDERTNFSVCRKALPAL